MPLWKEFAIEPDLFANFNLGSEILSGIGVEHGRIIGALPKKWAQRVRDVGREHNKDKQQLKLIERLNHLKATIVPRDFAFDGNRPWQDQAFEAHVQKPFHALLLNGTNANAASIDATLGLLGVPLWEADRKLVVPRNSHNLVSALSFLLGQARVISIVDSYFDPSVQLRDSRWLKPIHAIAKALPTDGRLNRFEIHACNSWDPKRRWQPGIFVSHCRNNLSAALPKGIKAKALLWQERKDGPEFHERIIVTDLGGAVIDPGVDEGPAGKMYTLRLMGNAEIQEYFTKFTPTSAPYDLIDEVDITGT
jgi:hypothetical protein